MIGPSERIELDEAGDGVFSHQSLSKYLNDFTSHQSMNSVLIISRKCLDVTRLLNFTGLIWSLAVSTRSGRELFCHVSIAPPTRFKLFLLRNEE